MRGEDGVEISQEGQIPGSGSESTDDTKDLVVPSSHIQSVAPEEVKTQNEMNLDTARIILQALVDTHEDTFTEDTPFDRVGGYTTDQIRQAEEMVARAIIQEYSGGAERGSLEAKHASKETPDGTMHLMLLNDGTTDEASLNLTLKEGKKYLLVNEFSLREPDTMSSRFSTRFSDFRSGQPDVTALSTLDYRPTLANFRKMVRGTRWMSANMLAWQDPNAIMPEQLDNRAHPPSQPAISEGK